MPGYPTHPAHPERVCWGCDEYCPVDNLSCGKDTVRTPHPAELFGDDWDRESSAKNELVEGEHHHNHCPKREQGSSRPSSASICAGRHEDCPIAGQEQGKGARPGNAGKCERCQILRARK
jgi:hypothetical protein